MKAAAGSIDRLWYFLLGRGVVGALVGLVLLSNPFTSGRALAGLFAVAVILDGALAFLSSRALGREEGHGGELAAVAVIDLLTAVLALVFPAALSLRVIAGLRGVLGGLADVLWARRLLSTELFALAGFAAMGTGLLLLAWPGAATLALSWLLALALIVPAALLVGGALSEIRRRRDICALLHDVS